MKKNVCFLLGIFCVANLSALAEEELFYSQYKQDQFVYEKFFKDKREGVFVDVGAHDGVTINNTYFFEKAMGWTGICIEPIPEVFASLQKNRTCLCVEGCIFEDRESVPFLRILGYSEMLSGIVSNYDPEHAYRVQRDLAVYGGESEVIQVRAYDLTKLLLNNNIVHVDYLSIDTEGGELNIIKSIDFSLIDVEVIGVENNYRQPFEPILQSLGYEKVASLGVDEIYKKKRL